VIHLRHPDGTCSLPVRVTVCEGFVSRLLGALPEGGIARDRGLVFPDCRQIHTWFMRRPIAVLTYDDRGRTLRYHARVKPFRILPFQPDARGLLELAPGRLDETPVAEGETCELGLESDDVRRAGLGHLLFRGDPAAPGGRSVSPRKDRS